MAGTYRQPRAYTLIQPRHRSRTHTYAWPIRICPVGPIRALWPPV